MKFLIQSKLHDPANGVKGNCMMTCYASYFDLDIKDVPPLEDFFDCQPEGFWYQALCLYLSMYYQVEEVYQQNDPYHKAGWKDYYFATGPSPRGVNHMVIYKEGRMVHDPHPSGAGLLQVSQYIILKKIA